jgi:hypothetical protein
MTDDADLRGVALALLTREVICEQVYRTATTSIAATGWPVTGHVCTALKMREISPEEIVRHSCLSPLDSRSWPGAASYLLSLNSKELKIVAAKTLDAILADRDLLTVAERAIDVKRRVDELKAHRGQTLCEVPGLNEKWIELMDALEADMPTRPGESRESYRTRLMEHAGKLVNGCR